ncbi:MAG: dihydroorotase [Candidatus Contendobacter odensis]|uniref:Dihydroorotase n=1 Tax=Candidatus Contendibacter odensensis TaxID=1400860 RepID=A0A2G6PHA1_9GAMM|nr:MAG: dihydroorotase [Candidatus Contendobacter odensis]
METLTLTRPDDWHLHLRDGVAMRSIVAHSADQFARAIIMPNLQPPVTTTQQALAYRQRILEALPTESVFQPLMTLYLTDNTPPAEISDAKAAQHIKAAKLYPAGATTNSDSGVTDIGKIYPTLEAMQQQELPLLVHGEITDPDIDIFDREALFIEQILSPLVKEFPALKIVMEHITTQDAADYVRDAPDTVAATITAHHLLYNRNAIFQGGIRPHYYCLPILKRERHRQALLKAATGGNPKYFLGTDSAPHPRQGKESACGCAGCYTAHAALELYAEAFDTMNALDRLEAFASFHGADFYGLPRNTGTVTLHHKQWRIPKTVPFGEDHVIPLRAGQVLGWQLVP